MKKYGQANTFLPFILIAIVIIFIFAIIVVPIAEVADQVFDALKGVRQVEESNKTTSTINQVQGMVTPIFDQLVFVILIAMVLGSLVIAIFTDYHPVVLGVMILSIIFLVLISGLFVNVNDEFKENPIIENKSAEFTLTNAIMGSYFPIIIGFIGILAVIILLSKRGGQVVPI